MARGFDIIGDVHGHAAALRKLLAKLGYENQGGCFRHPQRKAVFVGDLIDRGPENFKTLEIVKPMADQKQALIVMGNHEYNALCFHSQGDQGNYLRRHSEKNYHQHKEVLEEIAARGEREWQAYLEWFRKMPLFLEMDGFRVVHACWDQDIVDFIKKGKIRDEQGRLTKEFLVESSRKGTPWFEAVEILLKGKEIGLPPGHPGIFDKDGILRKRVRLKWWLPWEKEQQVRTYDQVTRAEPKTLAKLMDVAVPAEILQELRKGKSCPKEDDTPVFIGHYWFTSKPKPLTRNVACLDYSVARGGKLVCYPWDGEKTLDQSKFTWA